MFGTIIDPSVGLTAQSAVFCTLTSAGLGLVAAFLYRLNNPRVSKNLMVTLVVLPILVQSVIMMVNGSVGAGLAVMGAFNLVRFRSAPGTSRELCYVFLVMGVGLATGMGYLGFALMITLAAGIILAVLGFTPLFGIVRSSKLLRILIPEDLDYTTCFGDLFKEYTISHRLLMSKTVSMGTLYELRYELILKDLSKEKEFLDKIRARNGNLTVMCSLLTDNHEEM
ncbi:MAG: DUF4956 domain-containing protein [Oscillospiraceae bacterium]|nr:DUF4956 domain-containing protein [Oscillospiraceae bacterium]